MVDKHGDQMGFAVLKIPTKHIKAGEQVSIKINGTAGESNAWVMTFKAELNEKLEIFQTKTVSKKNGKLFHTARFSFIHLGESENVIINIGKIKKKIQLNSQQSSANHQYFHQ